MNIFTQLQVDVLIAAAVVALCLIVVLVLRLTRRHRAPPGPLPVTAPLRPLAKTGDYRKQGTTAAPYLESPDGRTQMPLRLLTGAGSVIGRGPSADLTVDSALPHAETVADRHARICQDEATGYVMIEDLDSANGVFINGRRAPRKNLLKDRWTIGLGSLTLVYRDGNSDTGRLE